MSNEKNYHSPLFGITAFLEDLEVVSSGFVFQNQFKFSHLSIVSVDE
jgi:uncharacterized HAD superfamily protein